MTKNWRAILALAIILIYGSYVCFVNLNDLPIGNWDEATNGCNTFEMDNRGDFLVKYLNGKEDLWNTKPPLDQLDASGVPKGMGRPGDRHTFPYCIFRIDECPAPFLFLSSISGRNARWISGGWCTAFHSRICHPAWYKIR